MEDLQVELVAAKLLKSTLPHSKTTIHLGVRIEPKAKVWTRIKKKFRKEDEAQ